MAQHPAAWVFEVPGMRPALFHDLGQAIGTAVQLRGQVSPLFKGAPLTPQQLQDQALDAPKGGSNVNS